LTTATEADEANGDIDLPVPDLPVSDEPADAAD
jgi:hypothetical protein